jgi:hypothetical protein
MENRISLGVAVIISELSNNLPEFYEHLDINYYVDKSPSMDPIQS